MALSLNFTLIIQALNFIVAYWIISRFFLKPAYKLLQAEYNNLNQLRSKIKHEQEYLEIQTDRKRKDWRECQNYFYKHRPEVEAKIQKIESIVPPLSSKVSLEPSKIDTITLEIVRALKPRIVND